LLRPLVWHWSHHTICSPTDAGTKMCVSRVVMRSLVALLCWSLVAEADLRMACRPRESYKLRNENGAIKFIDGMPCKYMEPSTFEYKNLAGNNGQKRKNYDQFLRSNIDNEQDNRDFGEDDGHDHLPFRTMNTQVQNQESQIALTWELKPGQTNFIPLRWNNPHSSELEVNIWIMSKDSRQKPVVVPIRKPTCSGEGHQDLVLSFTIPLDFASLGGKIPGFTGCRKGSESNCILQGYAHSVESRTYAFGIPILVSGHVATQKTTSLNQIQEATQDPGLNLEPLRDMCLSSADASANIQTAVPRWANMWSDVYNHAYMNSDFSPYQGQQHESISKNLQASIINKMIVGNRGELGKARLPNAMKNKLNQLQNLENKVYKAYESLANKVINKLGNQMKNTGVVTALAGTQELANCFRCQEVGSTNAKRLQTNTYIPSFTLPQALIAEARKLVPTQYSDLINDKGQVQIYVSALNSLMSEFDKAKTLGIVYQTGVTRNDQENVLNTKQDTTQFKKRKADGRKDDGKYAATEALKQYATSINCPASCLDSETGAAPLLKDTKATSITGACQGCQKLFENLATKQIQIPVTPISAIIGVEQTLPDIGGPPLPDYLDADGSPRIGRPEDPTTTTRVQYVAPPPIGAMSGAARTSFVGILLGSFFMAGSIFM